MDKLDNTTLLLIVTGVFLLFVIIALVIMNNNRNRMLKDQQLQLQKMQLELTRDMSDFKLALANALKSDLNSINDTTADRMSRLENRLNDSMMNSLDTTGKAFNELMMQVAGLQKTQEHLDTLTKDISSLQSVLTDKKTRGIFGEVELYSILESSFGKDDSRWRRQYTLANGKMPDAVIVAPKPLGLIPVDSKFPLENYNRIYDENLPKAKQEAARNLFRSDCLKHIKDINEKYVNGPDTSEFAFMFVPAEAVFAEIYGHYDEIVEAAYKAHVFIVSPTTLMAYITAIKSIYLEQTHNEKAAEIQQQLQKLADEFGRFAVRWKACMGDIEKLWEDSQKLDTTSRKINRQFTMIRQGDLNRVEEIENEDGNETAD